jgi:periplasmic protein TonB
MFDTLIASTHRSPDQRLLPSGLVAILAHAGACALAMAGTLRPDPASGAEGPRILIQWPQASDAGSRPNDLDRIPGLPALPMDVPSPQVIGLPPLDAGAPFDARLLLRGAGDAPGDRGVDEAPDGPWSPAAVEEPPLLLAGPPLAYPELLRRTGTVGHVVVRVVIDTLGRAEPRSLVLESSHAGFEAAARAYVLGALFRPGRVHGRAVRVLVRLPIGFTLTPAP